MVGSGSSVTGAASTVVRDNLTNNVVLASSNKRKIAAAPLSISQLQGVITGGATTIIDYNPTPNKGVGSDADGKVSASSVSNIEVGDLAGTNDLIQIQLNRKANQSTTYTKAEVDNKLALNTNQATTYTKTEVDSNLATTYKQTEVDRNLASKQIKQQHIVKLKLITN